MQFLTDRKHYHFLDVDVEHFYNIHVLHMTNPSTCTIISTDTIISTCTIISRCTIISTRTIISTCSIISTCNIIKDNNY